MGRAEQPDRPPRPGAPARTGGTGDDPTGDGGTGDDRTGEHDRIADTGTGDDPTGVADDPDAAAGRLRERVRAGDRDAFAALYDSCAKAVYNHAHRLTGDWAAAEEVMSETFLVAWRTRQRVEPDAGPLLPWLLGIATNKARNHRRSVGRRLAFLGRQPRPADAPDFADASAARLDDAARLDAVQQAWGRLRRQEREVLALRVGAGLDYAQTAAALGVPVGTVRSRLSRARARLHDLVERRLAEDGRAAEREPRPGHGERRDRTAFTVLPIEEEAR